MLGLSDSAVCCGVSWRGGDRAATEMAARSVEAKASGESGVMGLEELLGLPATVNVVTAARALGISRNKAYALINSGEFPVKTLTLGNQVRVPTVAL
ncbi:helix-turn-helix domain-containing protein [Streptomyces lunaelactis]|uniref:helix-turn-helix domain-containing protein n=1 Tax=Streptomyces lunaelactis TaxID=1535768 RepID=UPI00281692F0|nr:helix-turn-helix domain-containing protein [Streptomyces lunaelactis]